MELTLVTGATGNVGRPVVTELLAAGVPVRALTRSPERAHLPAGAEVVAGDMADPASVAAALDGVGAVFLVWPFASADGAAEVVAELARHPRRVVFLSASTAPDDEEAANAPDAIFHARIESLIRRTELAWTFLRAGGFATNTLQWADEIRGGVVRWIHGEAGRSLIHERDIADVAVKALTEDGHAGARYVLTGPEVLTQIEQVRTIAETVGREVRWEPITPAAAREQLLAQGWPPEFADRGLKAWADMVKNPEPVTTTVEQITGHPARTFAEWTQDHTPDFH